MYFIYSLSSQFHFRITTRLAIGEFRIPGQWQVLFFCEKARLMRVTSHQEDKQTMRKLRLRCQKKETLKL